MATKEQTRKNRPRGWKLLVALAAVMLAGAAGMRAASNQVIYDDALESGWQFWGWATANLNNTAPTHSGHNSIKLNEGAWTALYLHNGNAGKWDPTGFNTLVFWAHGGTAGGQVLSLVGLTQDPKNPSGDTPQLTVALPPLLPNTWTQIQTPLASLGVANNKAFSALYLMNNSGSELPVFYVDDIQLTSVSAPTNPAPTEVVGANDLILYDDQLNTSAWGNWSWATSLSWNNPSPVHSGTRSVAAQLAQWTAVALHPTPPLGADAYTDFIFWVNGGPQGGQTLTVQATIHQPGTVPVDGVYEHTNVLQTSVVTVGPLPANTWQQQRVPLSALGLSGTQKLGDLWIWNTTDANPATFYLDDLRMVAATSAPPAVVANIAVDAAAARHPIDPRIYGTAYATPDQLAGMNATVERKGGDSTSTYNWKINAHNLASNWYFESWPSGPDVPGGEFDDMIAADRVANAASMVTIPLLDWVAKLGPDRSTIWSFSQTKYGLQEHDDWWAANDPYIPDAGNGRLASTHAYVIGNEPNDAYVPSNSEFQKGWIQHLTNRWGTAAQGGVKYYIMDNEPSIWHGTHRDVHPKGASQDEFLARFIEYASMVKSVDPSAMIVGPEEWSWPGYVSSGLDQQNGNFKDRDAHGGRYYLPWLLSQLQRHEQTTGQRLIDVFSVHNYGPGTNTSTATQLLRNRSTRSLWDTNYIDESWISQPVQMIPRLKAWVASCYPGLQTAITEYNWGAEDHINGATAQADILGIFGREGLDLATRWTAPDPTNFTFTAIQMYRNYDGNKSTFGDLSVLATGPNPDYVSVFAALRSSDQALTVMVINKQLTNAAPLNLTLANFNPAGSAQAWRLAAANRINRQPDLVVNDHAVTDSLPAQSITLYVVPAYMPRPSLVIPAGPMNGRLGLVLGGIAGQRYVVEASPDLKAWKPVATNVLTAAMAPVTVPAADSARFYRALAAP